MAEREFPDYHDRLAAGLCPHPDCGRVVSVGRLACPYHWSLLPIDLRRAITRAWGQILSGTSQGAQALDDHDRAKGDAFAFWADAGRLL